jgi:hypothetical protein
MTKLAIEGGRPVSERAQNNLEKIVEAVQKVVTNYTK